MPKFNLMSYILPPEDKLFFAYFQEIAEICQKSARLYDEIVKNNLTEEYKEIALKYKKKGKIFYRAILKQLNKSFITPIEREDIQTIAVQLHKINKKTIKACLNFAVYNLKYTTREMEEQALTLIEATDKMCEMVKKFKKVSNVEEMTAFNIEMKDIETHGDEILRRATASLYSGKYEALEVLKFKDIYKEVENALDKCYLVTDTILNVVLKQS